MRRPREEAEEDDGLLAGDEERQEPEVAAAPRGGEEQPETEREEGRDPEGDLEEERLDGTAEDEPETRTEGRERVRGFREAEGGPRLRDDGANGAGGWLSDG